MSDKPRWQTLPDEPEYWWWWNGDLDSLPVPVFIMRDCASRYFATAGQLGWTVSQYVEDMGGFWLRLREPDIADVESEVSDA
jgi:hypothetical protein